MMNSMVTMLTLAIALLANAVFWLGKSKFNISKYYSFLVIFNNIFILFFATLNLETKYLYFIIPIIAFNVLATIKNTGICENCNSFIKKGWSDTGFQCAKCRKDT